MSPVDLSGYTDVKERIRLFYERHPDGRLVTTRRRVTSEPDGVPRVWVYAKAYRSPDDTLPGEGSSWMVLPGSSNFTRGSELENTETSAWGRAIGSLGIGIAGGIGSADEVRNKSGESERTQLAVGETAPTPASGLIGVVDVRQEWLSDLELRQTPEGPVIGFRLKQGRQTQKVQAHGSMALAVAALPGLAGATVTAWGTLVGQEYTPKGTTRTVPYQVLRLERLHGPTFDLPPTDTTPEPSAPPEPSGVGTEAPSEPLFPEATQAEVDAELERILG